MQNDVTTVEPPTSVTAVSISDDNCFQSPVFSDLLVGFSPFCQKLWKFRLRNKWNASFRVPSLWKSSGQSTGCPNSVLISLDCLWWKWSTSTGGPLWPVGLIRSKIAVPCQKILVSISTLPSSNQTFSQNWMEPFELFGDFGRFTFNQKVWFAFLAENGSAFSKIFKKRAPCEL